MKTKWLSMLATLVMSVLCGCTAQATPAAPKSSPEGAFDVQKRAIMENMVAEIHGVFTEGRTLEGVYTLFDTGVAYSVADGWVQETARTQNIPPDRVVVERVEREVVAFADGDGQYTAVLMCGVAINAARDPSGLSVAAEVWNSALNYDPESPEASIAYDTMRRDCQRVVGEQAVVGAAIKVLQP